MPKIRPQGPLPPAVVVGLDSMQGLQLARILDRHGVEVFGVVADAKFYATKSRSVVEWVEADTSSDALVDALLDLGRKLGRRSILFPCQDPNVLVVSRNREALAEWFDVKLPPHDVVEMLVDKVRFLEFAAQAGLPIPETRVVRSRTDVLAASRTMRFPCVLKPPSRSSRWLAHTKEKAFRVDDPEALVGLWDRYHDLSDVFIVQDWIDGTDADLYSCNAYFDDSGACLASFVARKLRQWPPVTGQSCLGEEVEAEEVRDVTMRLFSSVPYVGFAYLEMKKDRRTGDYLIVEPNVGRPTGRSAIAEAGGVELHYAMYCDAAGIALPSALDQRYTGVKWIHLLRDIQSAAYYWRAGDLTIFEILRSWRGRKAYAVWSVRDPLPFLWALVRSAAVMRAERRQLRAGLAARPNTAVEVKVTGGGS